MKSIIKFITISSIFSLVACGELESSSSLPAVENAALPQTHSQYFLDQMKKKPERQTQRIIKAFSKLSVDDKVAISDLQDIANKQAAVSRAQIISAMLVLDIDGTGDVSAQEMISISKEQVRLWNYKNSKYLPYGQADTNEDNIITLREMVSFARKHASYDKNNSKNYDLLLNIFNADNDEHVTRAELEAGLNEIINTSLESKDISKNASLKKAKRLASEKVIAEKKVDIKSPPTACIPKPPSKEDQVVFVSTYNGGGYSSVALGNLDEVTEVIRLVIEDGDSPLYIMGSTFNSRIWLLEGDTKRVKKFVTSSHKFPQAKVGVSGLPKDKIEFLDKGCLEYFQSEKQTKGIIAKAKWTKLLNRAPDNIVAGERLATTAIPSGKKISEIKTGIQIINGDKPPVNFDFEDGAVTLSPAIKSKAWGVGRFKPDGVIHIDPKSVISEHKAVSYEVLPANAGLDQLSASGHLIELEHNAYKIVKSIPHFPAKMNYRNKFILGKNVPMPKGSPGRASIYSEETGECLVKRCR